MQYTKFITSTIVVSLVSITASAFAATGATVTSSGTTAGTATVTATGVTVGNIAIGTGVTTSLEVKTAPKLVKKTASSITLEWDKVASASAYIVKYSKTSVATSKDPNAIYDNEIDPVTSTGVTIEKLSSTNEKLTANTAYYFSVVAVDKDGKESDSFSDELMVTTDADGAITAMTTTSAASGTIASLAIATVTMINDRTMSVVFNTELSNDALKAKIGKTSDNSDVTIQSIVKDAMNPKAALVTLAAPLAVASSYTLAIISAKDIAGNTIQEGVNGLKEFTTPETMIAAAGSVVGIEAASGSSLSGAVAPVVEATKVATGTQENLLVLAALILSVGIAYIYRRKLV